MSTEVAKEVSTLQTSYSLRIGREVVDIVDYIRNGGNLRRFFVAQAREHRYGGLLDEDITYTVTDHHLLVSALLTCVYVAPARAILGGLLHDFAEGCGLRDLPSPVKKVMRFEGDYAYDWLHEQIDIAVANRFGFCLTLEDEELIAKADHLALRLEQFYLQQAIHDDIPAKEWERGREVFWAVLTANEVRGRDTESERADLYQEVLDEVLEVYQRRTPMFLDPDTFTGTDEMFALVDDDELVEMTPEEYCAIIDAEDMSAEEFSEDC